MNDKFQNLQVDLETLPKVEEIDFVPIDLKYLKVSFISSVLFLLILGIAAFLVIYFNPDDITKNIYLPALGIYLLVATIHLTMLKLGFKKKKYSLREKDIVYTKGLLWSVRTAIPFNRIQHAEIKQGPLERKFYLSSLKVFTAGGQGSDLVIPGLPSDKAQKLKDFVLGKTAEDGA